MLAQAGVAHEVQPAGIDEAAVKRRSTHAEAIALELACAKALAISRERPDDWVIGSDSVAAVDGRLFDKPRDRDEAAGHLRFFSGKTMRLSSAVALATDGRVDWNVVDSACLQVRNLSDDFVEAYLDAEWPAVAGCVGVFRAEGRGVQLFDAIDGGHFTILGMPLIPLLGALRARGLVAS